MAATIAAGAVSSSAEAAAAKSSYFELRYYRMRQDRTEQSRRTTEFLSKVYLPAAKSAGAGPIGLFSAGIAPNAPFALVLTSYPSLAVMQSVREKLAAGDYQKALADYNAGEPAYQRMESSILRGFDSFPSVEVPAGGAQRPARMFELRTYEALNETLLQKKIDMFAAGEIDIFRRCGLTPVMFGESIAGSNMPHITYMVSFENLAAREKNWAAFSSHPDWEKLRTDPRYNQSGMVINIHNAIVSPLPASEIR